MSPEESILGAQLDEMTNVYTLGAVAFALFADCKREESQWTLGRAAYKVAKKAVDDEREKRYPTIQAFMDAWEAAVKETGGQ